MGDQTKKTDGVTEITGQPGQSPTPSPADQGVPRFKPANVSSFLEKAPLMKKVERGEPPEPEGGIPAPKVSDTKPEAGEGDEGKPEKQPLVQGPSAKQAKPEKKPDDTAGGEKPKGETEGVTVKPGQKIKIGDLEYTSEEWERIGKDYGNDQTWKAKNTKRSQLINTFNDEQLSELAPYALAQRKLPANIKQELEKLEEIPKEITVQDAEGYDVKIKVTDLPDQFLEALKSQIAVQVFPEFINMAQENARLKNQAQSISQQVTAQDIEAGTKQAVAFMKEYPDCAVTVYPGDDLAQILADIHQAGPDHPEFENARRFGVLLNSISQGLYSSFDEAATKIFGPKEKKKAVAEKIAENQKGGKPEEPAARNTPVGGGQELIGAIRERDRGAKYKELGR